MKRPFPAALALLILSALTHPAWPATRARDFLNKPDDWFSGEQAKTIAANILSWQSPAGGWPKNVDTASAPYTRDRSLLKPTFDNGATTDELRFLARMIRATKEAKYTEAFVRGYDHILKAQYPTGGWPQFYPPDNQYHRHFTFNDDAMVRLMTFLRETWTSDLYNFLDEPRKTAARAAFDKGVDCILKCQIKIDGKLTAWCAQHDEIDYSPRPARTFELASLSGQESVGITRLLMSLDNPSPEIVRSIEAAIAWFEASKLKGIRVETKPDPKSPKGKDRVVVQDPNAPPMWARFYDLKTNQPIYADRDGAPKPNLADIGYERRNGYAWLGTWPATLLEKDYPAWRAKWKDRLPK